MVKCVNKFIALCFVILLSFLFIACSSKDGKIKITYSNEMTQQEKDALSIDEKNSAYTEVVFYDDELDNRYIMGINTTKDYDEGKKATLLLVLGNKMNDKEQSAINEYMSVHKEPIISMTVQYLEDNIKSEEILKFFDISPNFRGSLTDVELQEMYDFAGKPEMFSDFLTKNVLGWLCENYSIDINNVVLAGFGNGGYFATYSLLTDQAFSNYLIVNSENQMTTDDIDLVTREEEYSLNTSNNDMPSNVCFIKSGDEAQSYGNIETEKLLEALKLHNYENLKLQAISLDGYSKDTSFCESLIRGLGMLKGWNYGAKESEIIANEKKMSSIERESITTGMLSSEHMYYQEVIDFDADAANYIQELTLYDEEIEDAFLIHISLPPNYNQNKSYPLLLMTDGIWRLSDHPELRKMMVDNEIEDVILVSVGYPNEYDATTIRERDLVESPDLYYQFLVENLLPYLCEQYNVDTQRLTLTGHSYGGYFGLYALFHSDTIGENIFDNYYVGSPSLQCFTDVNDMITFESLYYKRSQSLDNKIYITIGSLEDDFKEPVGNFIDIIENRDYEGIDIVYDIIEGHGHNTVFKPSIKNTVLWFYGIE